MNSHIRVAPDGTGKRMQTYANLIGGLEVHAEAVSLVGTDGLPIGSLPVLVEGLPVDTYSVASFTATSGTTALITPSGSNKVRVFYAGMGADGANADPVNVGLRFTAGGTDFFKVPLLAGALWGRNIGAGRRYLEGGAGEALCVNLSTAVAGVYINIEYQENP